MLGWPQYVEEEEEVTPNLPQHTLTTGTPGQVPGVPTMARTGMELSQMLSLLVFMEKGGAHRWPQMSQRVGIPRAVKWGTHHQGQGYSSQGEDGNSAEARC